MGCMSSKGTDDHDHGTPSKPPAPAEQKEITSSPPPTPAQPTPAPTPTPAPVQQEPPQQQGQDEDGSDSAISIHTGIEDFYTIGSQLGEGGYAVVKKGIKKDTNEKVAIKIIDLAALENDDTGVDDPLLPLKREIKITQKIDHPNIIKLFEIFVDEEEGKFFLVMELMPGGQELFQRIEEVGHYSEKDSSKLFRQVVSAVEYLHARGIAHRDLKPENVLVCGKQGEEVCKLADFGFAKHFKEEQMKTALGSPAYAAPELFTEESYNEAVDIWSLGVMLYVLLSGSLPFVGDTIKELSDKIISADFDFDDQVWETVSNDAKDIIIRLLVKDPTKRLTAKQLKENLWVQGLTDKTK